jgi:outer membrane receptor protein involved in Fe transport
MKFWAKVTTLLFLTGFCILAVTTSSAQVTEGGLNGYVFDPKGSALANSHVTVTNVGTGQKRVVTTDAKGFYQVPFLIPGAYDLTATHEGFSTGLAKGIQVQTNGLARADIQLAIGSVQATVDVTDALPVVNTEEARIFNTLSEAEVQDLPTPGRDVYALGLLQPGVTATLAPAISNTGFNQFDYGTSANGGGPRGNVFVVDGVSNNNEWLGGTPAISPSVESIQSLQVQTANFSAEYGRGSGSVSLITTRSGTNKFHGSVYDYVRNPMFDARRSSVKQNNFGFAFGGPIHRDRTFFFVNYEGIRGTDSQTLLSSGETPEFRQQVALYRPTSIANAQLQAYPSGPCVDAGVDTFSIFLKTLPLETVQAIPFYQFFDGPPDTIPDFCTTSYVDRRPKAGNQVLARIDHNFGPQDTFFARFLYTHNTTDTGREELNGANTRGFKAPFAGTFPSGTLGYTHVFNPRLLNDLHFLVARSDFGIGFTAPKSGSNNYPWLFFDDGTTPFGGEVFVPRTFVFNNFSLYDSLAVTRGSHALKFGFDVEHLQENSNYQSETNGFYEFQDPFTFANDGPYYTEASVNPVTGQFTSTPRHFRQTWWGMFAQDDWKLSRRLTVNLGLRYDVFRAPTETNGIVANMKFGGGSTTAARVASATVGRVGKLFNTDYKNFAPRVGFAFDPYGNGNTVIHGSFSMAYLPPYSNLYTNASRFDPPDTAFPFVFPLFYGGTISYGVPAIASPGFETGLSPAGGIPGVRVNISGVDQNLKTAYSQQWFFGIQHRLAGLYSFTADYVGTRGRDLYIRDDINRFTGDRSSLAVGAARFNPNFGGTTFVQNGPGSNYNGVNLQLQRQMKNNYGFTINYTWSKALDNVSDPGLGDYSNVNTPLYIGTMDEQNPRLDYGPSEFDARHKVSAYGTWILPNHFSNPVLRSAIGGWQLNGTLVLQSGRPFSVICTNILNCDYNGDGVGYDRPNTPAFGNTKTGLSRSDYQKGIFVPADFPNPNAPDTLGKNGNLGRNTFRGPGYANADASIFKTFSLPRETSLEFRAEAFNLFNRVNLYLPVSNLSQPFFFGKSTTAFPARNMQFALKLRF